MLLYIHIFISLSLCLRGLEEVGKEVEVRGAVLEVSLLIAIITRLLIIILMVILLTLILIILLILVPVILLLIIVVIIRNIIIPIIPTTDSL